MSFLQKRVEDAVESHGFRIPSGMGFGRDKDEDEDMGGYMKNKALPLPTLIEILQQRTGKNDIDVGNLRPTLFDVFGDDASPKVKKFMKFILTNFRTKARAREQMQVVGSWGWWGHGHAVFATKTGRNQWELRKTCHGNPSDASQAYGALSNAIQMIIAETNGRVSNRDLVLNARGILKRQGYTQRPGLYCSDNHVHAPFIC
ncbi:UNVERIFIED_CONTAM: Metacaspase-5 [Sesamum angustifolium]|uniref:Metacaspase-5 n=1 Tax=Sesamum angustifolium TaxID=2727405 RepID=A0AAW2KUT2_9LAMI